MRFLLSLRSQSEERGREKEECARDETKNNAEEESRRPQKWKKKEHLAHLSRFDLDIDIDIDDDDDDACISLLLLE